jgi:hypothetical protein
MTIGSHQSAIGKSQTHITPKWLLDKLGEFDFDPCAAAVQPWPCARDSAVMDGLERHWHGRVFLNPPFDRRVVGAFIFKLARHNNGIALLHVRPEAEWFQPVWRQAKGVLMLRTRIKFCLETGEEQPFNSGAPVCLAAFGQRNLETLRDCGIQGTLLTDWEDIE